MFSGVVGGAQLGITVTEELDGLLCQLDKSNW